MEKTLTGLRLGCVFFFFSISISISFKLPFRLIVLLFLSQTNKSDTGFVSQQRYDDYASFHVYIHIYNSQTMSCVSVYCCSVKGPAPKQSRSLSSRKCNSIASLIFCYFFASHFISYDDMACAEAPRLSSQLDGKSRNDFLDVDFEERLKTVRRCTLHSHLFLSF